MRYAWKVSRLRHLIFATDRPVVLGGRAMALHQRNKPIQPAAPRLLLDFLKHPTLGADRQS
jgi:hypothetical protein